MLADPRWATPAEEYRNILGEIERGGDKLDDSQVQDLSKQLTVVHTTLRAAAGRQFVEVFYVLRAEYVETPAQAAALKKFSRRAVALRSRSALKAAAHHGAASPQPSAAPPGA